MYFIKKFRRYSNWNTYKATDISYLLYDYISLKNISDISKWNIINIKNREYIFPNNVQLYINFQNIIKEIFSYLPEKYLLNMIIYNKKLQNKFGLDMKMYKKISGKYKIGGKNGKGKEYLINNNILIFEGEYLNGKEKNIIMMEN